MKCPEKTRDLTGMRFGRLTVIAFHSLEPRWQKKWLCRCDCGKECTPTGGSLCSGHTASCGCLHSERRNASRTKHGKARRGQAKSVEYNVWSCMIGRCRNTKDKRYGGRGIKVCERWQSFEAFYQDMGDRPEGHTLDRIDVNGNYEPSNCRWATNEEQSSNKRNSVFIEAFGKRQTAAQWSAETGVKQATIRARLKNGWDAERAIAEVPV